MFTLPLIAVPTLTVLMFGVYGLFETQGLPVVSIESAIELAALLVVYSAGACMFGLHRSLHSRKTVQAVMVAVGGLVVGCLVLTYVVDSIVVEASKLGAAIAPLTPFTGVRTLLDPVRLFDGDSAKLKDEFASLRMFAFVGSAIAILVYAMVVGGVYKSMVRNFDMTVRKQSGQW